MESWEGPSPLLCTGGALCLHTVDLISLSLIPSFCSSPLTSTLCLALSRPSLSLSSDSPSSLSLSPHLLPGRPLPESGAQRKPA